MTSKLLRQVISERDNFYGEPLLDLNVLPQKTSSEPLTVSVVIPAYNVQLSILACLTAIANDYGWEHIFSRQISVLAKKGDIVIGLSTSGSSENVLNGLKKAYDMGIETLDFPRLGETTGEIQNYQVKLMHEVCEIVEDHLYFKSYRNDN